MNITFYNTPSEYNKLDKALNAPLARVGHLVNDSSILSPVITFSYNSDLLGKNYCYIPAFTRYYFVEEMTVNNKVITVSLRCDALMSHKTAILNSYGRIVRSGNMGNKYIVDDMVTLQNKMSTQVRKLGNGFTKADNYIMNVGGSN